MGEKKVIQIVNICKDMCNVPNPIPGRVYYAKGCSPALNTCGGEKTDVFMDKTKVNAPPVALRTRTHQRQRQRAGQPHIILSRQPLLRMRHRHTIQQPRNMDSRNMMKFIYKIPHGYFPGGAYFKYAPTVNSSAWSANNLLVWITPKDISSGNRTTRKAISPIITLLHCGRVSSEDAPETD